MEKMVIIGCGGHAKSVLDTIRSMNVYEIIGYTDKENHDYSEIEYLGTDDMLQSLFDSGVNLAAFGMGFMGKSGLRNILFEQLKNIGYILPTIVDPSAIIATDVTMEEGTFVGKRAVVNAGTHIGKACIINSGAIVEHENNIGDFSHVSVGATLCGNVIIGSRCLIGANATIIQGVSVGSDSIVGAGSVVLSDVDDYSKVVGVPAKKVNNGKSISNR